MKLLYLLRHAKSSWDDPSLDDFDRPLNPRGQKAARTMARYIDRNRIRPALILCSGAQRTRETLAAVKTVLPETEILIEDRLYEAAWSDLLDRLSDLPQAVDSVMLIGHNPGIERLASSLANSRDSDKTALATLREKYPSGALSVLELPIATWRDVKPGCARLASFVRPRDLE
ncbi:histidine phosphatase family protein [Telmatospirillum sp. J64-1]|uniref:SixA phosphatase family protein n=1 Tax=Telmatospirillum sp. J64-1 TaxID=2502183 RepID=UPI0021070706|nr:histidine phosphatase family protein [Telmatospirillum sp. J64-1]